MKAFVSNVTGERSALLTLVSENSEDVTFLNLITKDATRRAESFPQWEFEGFSSKEGIGSGPTIKFHLR